MQDMEPGTAAYNAKSLMIARTDIRAAGGSIWSSVEGQKEQNDSVFFLINVLIATTSLGNN